MTGSRPSAGRSVRFAVVCGLLCVVVSNTAAGQGPRSPWIDVRTAGPFVCRADFPLDGHQGLLGQLGDLQNDLTRTVGVAPAREAVELYLFDNQRAYQKYLKAKLPNVADRRALFVKGAGPGQVFVYRSRELAIDVRHESTHALLHASLPMVPLWLDEGLAEYFEVAAAERPFRKDYLDRLKWGARFGAAPRLVRLEEIRELNEMDEGDYRGAWAWVHFMLHGPPEARQELVGFLADVQAHAPPGRLSQRLERRLGDVERRMIEHLKRWPAR